MRHPLLEVMLEAAAGRPPAADCSVDLLPSPPGPEAAVVSFTAHARAHRYREELRVLSDPGDQVVLVLGRGLAGRLEVAFEVDPDRRGRGLGRAAATAARHLAARDEPVFAQVSPGNVASVRTLLAAGFVPVASEVLYARKRRG